MGLTCDRKPILLFLRDKCRSIAVAIVMEVGFYMPILTGLQLENHLFLHIAWSDSHVRPSVYFKHNLWKMFVLCKANRKLDVYELSTF